MIYIYVFDCLWENNTKKLYAKMRGRKYVVQTCACSKVSFGSLKRSADYNFSLEFLILRSSVTEYYEKQRQTTFKRLKRGDENELEGNLRVEKVVASKQLR